jgi:hypothetical protein
MVRGRGARDRSGDNSGGGGSARAAGGENRGGEARGGGNRGGDNNGGTRTATRRDDGDQRTASRRGDGGSDQQRYAVPRGSGDRDRTSGRRDNRPVVVTRNRPNININIGSSYRGTRFYRPVHYDRWARNYYRWSPLGYAPWSLIYGSIGFSNFGLYAGSPYYPYGSYGYGHYSSPWQASGHDVGGIRLRIRPRDAQVFVDGYYAGLVDDFDGTFQSLRLEQGGHKIEIHMPGFEDLELDVHVQAGRTITLDEDMRPRP